MRDRRADPASNAAHAAAKRHLGRGCSSDVEAVAETAFGVGFDPGPKLRERLRAKLVSVQCRWYNVFAASAPSVCAAPSESWPAADDATRLGIPGRLATPAPTQVR